MKRSLLWYLGLLGLGLGINALLTGGQLIGRPLRGDLLISPYVYALLVLVCINILLSSSLAMVNGFMGQFTMGHAGFMAIGAYSSAAVSVLWLPSASPFVHLGVMVVVSGIAAGLAGVLIGVPCLRLRGDYLGMTTLGFGEIIRVVLLNTQAVGGARGMTDIPQVMNLGWALGFALVGVMVIKRIRDSRYGRAMAAIRENELAATMMGMSLTDIKVRTFVLSSSIAGVAGGMFAHSEGYLSTQTFTFVKSFEIIAMNVIGGLGSLSGAVLGAVLLTFLPEVLRKVQDFTGIDLRMIIYSLTMILIMILRPKGLMGTKEFRWLSFK